MINRVSDQKNLFYRQVADIEITKKSSTQLACVNFCHLSSIQRTNGEVIYCIFLLCEQTVILRDNYLQIWYCLWNLWVSPAYILINDFYKCFDWSEEKKSRRNLSQKFVISNKLYPPMQMLQWFFLLAQVVSTAKLFCISFSYFSDSSHKKFLRCMKL